MWSPLHRRPAPMRREVELALDPALVLRAQRQLRRHISPTPTLEHPQLDTQLGAQTWIKLENTLPTGAFKIRGALTLLEALPAIVDTIVAPTRGNHGQALAWASRRLGRRCHLFVPRGNDRGKNAAMRALGAELHEVGDSFDEAAHAASDFARRTGARMVHPGGEPTLLTGIATLATELLGQVGSPLDAVYVPVGVGSCAGGVGAMFKALSPHTRVVGVQGVRAPALARAWSSGRARCVVPRPTLADGLAVGQPPPLTLALLRRVVDDMLLVEEEELMDAIRILARTVHQIAEGAGAAALAGARQHAERHGHRTIAVVLTGGNISPAVLSQVLAQDPGPVQGATTNL